jgi:hypothetical protein
VSEGSGGGEGRGLRRFSPTPTLRGVRRRTSLSRLIPMLGGGETTQRTLYVNGSTDESVRMREKVVGDNLSIMRKVTFNPYPLLLISYALVLTLLIVLPSCAQEATALQKVQSLKNPSFTNKITSLEDFERLYVGVGPNSYSWYQGKFLQRVAQVYEKKGLSFIAEVGKAFPAAEG